MAETIKAIKKQNKQKNTIDQTIHQYTSGTKRAIYEQEFYTEGYQMRP